MCSEVLIAPKCRKAPTTGDLTSTAELIAVAPAGRDERIMVVILSVVSVLMMIGGVVVLVGGSDPGSETGSMSQPGAAGLALLALGALCAGAARLLRRRHRFGVPATVAATLALGALGAFRLWRFGVVGLSDLLVPTLLAVLLVRSRTRTVAPSS